MFSGERDAADADVRMSTVRMKVDGRRPPPWPLPWLGLGLASAVLVAGGATMYATHAQTPAGVETRAERATKARSLFAAVDLHDAAAKTDLYAANPPTGGLVVLSDPTAQQGMPRRERFSLVIWYSATGKLCGVLARQADLNDAFCSYVNVDGAPKLADETGLVLLMYRAGKGYLWVLGSVPPAVTSVTAVSGGGPTQTAKVVNVPAGADGQFQLFTTTLSSAGSELDTVHFYGADASGRVVVTRETDRWGQTR